MPMPMPMKWVRGETIGRGAFATVSLAFVLRRDDDDDDDDYYSAAPEMMVAKSAPVDTDAASSLMKEESVLSDLRESPHVVNSYGHDTSDGSHNLFLEYLPGGTLADLLRRSPGGALPEPAVRRHARSLLRGIHDVHRHGYVHCDIKPENALLGRDGGVRIADFGLAKRAGEAAVDGGCTGFRGTPVYMSPESVAKSEHEPPADIWSFGCVVAELASGRKPWQGNDMWRALMRIGYGDESPENVPAALSEDGKDFLRRCFVRDPERRWTAEMLLHHPFVAALGEEEEEGIMRAVKVEDCWLSPRSVAGFASLCPSSCPSTSSMTELPELALRSPVGRIGELATGERPDWWSCSEEEGWISVREGELGPNGTSLDFMASWDQMPEGVSELSGFPAMASSVDVRRRLGFDQEVERVWKL